MTEGLNSICGLVRLESCHRSSSCGNGEWYSDYQEEIVYNLFVDDFEAHINRWTHAAACRWSNVTVVRIERTGQRAREFKTAKQM